jgi:hypothetical protein
MNLKTTFATAKNKINNHAPKIVGSGIVITTAVVTLAVKHLLDSKVDILRVSTDDQEWMIQDDRAMTYSVGGSDYSVRYLGETPPDC